jgi:hypothetical protein
VIGDRPLAATIAEQRPSPALIPVKESVMAAEPKRQEPDIPAQKPDIQPEPTPQEIPQDKDVPEKQSKGLIHPFLHTNRASIG